MAQATDAVWLSVLPDMSGFGKGLIKGAGKDTERQGKILGGRFGKAMIAGVAAVGAGAIAAGRALYGVGETFTEVTNTIRVGTGATGDDLDALVDSAKNVGRTVPAEFEDIGTTVADLNTRLGLTGDTLETVAAQVLEAGRITGEAIDINAVSSAFNQFKIEGEDTADAMDHLYRVSQATGIGMNDLASQAATAGPAMQQLGFSFEETTGMIGAMDKAGLNSSQMLSGLSRSLVNLARDGEEPAEAFQRVVGEIEGFIESGDKAAAIDLAGEVFGTRGAGQFVAALEDGSLAMDDLANVAGMTEDTILGAGQETMTFSEQWQMFKNDVLVAVEPAATRLFDAIGNGMEWIRDTGVPALKDAAHWIKENEAWLKPLAFAVGGMVTAWAAYQAVMVTVRIAQAAFNAVASANPLGLLLTAIGLVVGALVYFFTQTETGRKVIETVWGAIKTAISAVWDWLSGVFESMKDAMGSVGQWFSDRGQDMEDAWNSVKNALGVAWQWIRDNVFEPIKSGLSTVGQWFTDRGNDIKGAWDSVKNALKAGFDFIKKWTFDKMVEGMRIVWNFFSNRVDDIKGAWNSLKSAFKAVWDWIKDNVIDRFRQGIENIAGWVSDAVGNIDSAWRKIANKFRDPINWVINTVWNDGIARVFNNVADAIGISTRLSQNASIPRFAEGGRHAGGWALVGEEGPELVNFSDPARIYTAAETAQALAQGRDLSRQQSRDAAGSRPSEALAPMGDNWLSRAWGAVTGWVRGNLAAVAETVLDPITSRIASTMGQWGTTGVLFGDVMLSAKDRLINWIRGKDDEAPEVGADGWVRPSRGPITSRFGPRWGGHHAGIDVAGGGPTFAAAAGTVLRTGWNILAGRTGIGILLQHAKDLFTYYGHNPPGGVAVRPGDSVTAGQRIGRQGATGNVTGVHLHFELHRGGIGRAVNPEQLGVFDSGGDLLPGMLGANLSRKPEVVLTNQVIHDINRLAASGGPSLSPADLERVVDRAADRVVEGVLAGARDVSRQGLLAANRSALAGAGRGF